MNTLYNIMLGEEPPLFEVNRRAFSDLMFNTQDEVFEFIVPEMKGSPMWVSVTDVYKTVSVGQKWPSRAELKQPVSVE